MNDLRTDLRRASDSFGEPRFTFDGLERRRRRRDVRRRALSSTLALVLAALAGSLVWAGFRPGNDPGPGSGGRDEGVTLPTNGPISFRVGEVGGRMEGVRLGVVEPDGSARRILIDGMPEYLTGGWTTDGSKIVFSRDPEPTPDGDVGIWTMNADGTGLSQLTHGTSEDFDAQWSPDATRILFRRTAEGVPPAIFVMDADGSNAQPVANDPGLVYLGARWSPDGERILFVADTTADDGREGLGIYTMHADGSEVRRIYAGVIGTPQWSPDGTRILFEDGGRLLVMSDEGGDVQPVADGLEVNAPYVYRWSPDGSMVLYTRPVDSEHGEELWVAAVDGSGKRLVAEGLLWREPVSAWSPDGTMIAFVRGGDIWVVSVEDGQERQLTDSPERESVPSWGSA